jgi:hypothetical protein
MPLPLLPIIAALAAGGSANKTLERAVKHRARMVLAIDCVLADAQWRWWPAAQLGR